MIASLRALGEAALDLVLPPRCAACDELGVEPFCASCARSLEPAPPIGLVAAGRPLEVRALFAYGGAIERAILRLKYEGGDPLARPLGALLAGAAGDAHDRVLPIPTTPRRLRERGYNPTVELCRALGARVDARILSRALESPRQVGAAREARLAQVRGAFVVERPRSVHHRRVLLIDDVVTTGATLTACAEALYASGAARVDALTLARVGAP